MFEEKVKVVNEGQEVSLKRTYSVQEIMVALEVSRPTVYELIKANYFRAVRVGGQWRISKRSFDSWLDQSEEL